MIDFFKYEQGYWYPHMKPNDIAIWERFIKTYPTMYEKCQYDFAIGEIPPFIQNASSVEGQKMAELYKLKIDVIGWNKGVIDLIEIKPAASASTIGQVIGYKHIYEREFFSQARVRPVIITDELRPNMLFLTAAQDVQLWVV